MNKFLNLAFLLSSVLSFSQVGIGTPTPEASAQLDVTSTTKGLLPPRMTYAEKTVIPSPAKGLIVWCTDCGANGELQIYNGTWVKLAVETGSFGKPGVPRSPIATAGNGEAAVSFTAPVSDGGGAITGYAVTSSPGSFFRSGGNSPIVVTGLSNGTAYTFTVVATNQTGPSPSSAPTIAVTPSTMPNAPTNVIAIAGNAEASVAFTPSTSNGGSTIASYTVTSNPGFRTATGTSSPLVVTGLITGTSYTFTVVATNANGNSISSLSSVVIKAVSGIAICDANSVTEVVDKSSPNTGKNWMDRNLGASRTATSSDDFMAYGCMYQWGRSNDGHASVNWASSTAGTQVNGTTSTIATSSTPGNNSFITNQTDWRSTRDDTLWQTIGQTNNNPCPSGYSVPTAAQFAAELRNSNTNETYISNAASAFNQLQFVVAGDRASGSGLVSGSGGINGYGIYWTSTTSGNNALYQSFYPSAASDSDGPRSFGSSVRCIKNQ